MSESAVRSREEDDELQRSTKKVKENSRDRVSLEQYSPCLGGEGFSYKEKLIGDIPGAFEQAFNFENVMETEVEFDIEEEEELLPGEVVVKLSGDRKAKIRVAWNNGLIVKVFGRTVGYHYLVSKLTSMWKPTGKMDCIALGQDFFLIRFTLNDDHSKVLRIGPWFVGGYYLSIQRWEPNFIPSEANLVGHQAVGCSYIVQSPANADSATETEESLVPDMSETKARQDDSAFGPWTLVSRLSIDKKALTTFTASTEATLDSNVVNIALKTILSKSKARAPKGMLLGGSQKPRPNQAGLPSLNSNRQAPASVCKEVKSTSIATSSSPPFTMNGLANLKEGMNFVGFMAGGSNAEGSESACKEAGFRKEDHEEAVQPAREVMSANSPVECFQQLQEPDIALLAEISKHKAPNGELVIKGRETAPLVIPKELLKCIDPSLCPNKTDNVEEDERAHLPEDQSNRSEELDPSMRDDEASTDMNMQSEQGGEFSS
nr:hypothetical protein CFP56_42430 [Quercus suber]